MAILYLHGFASAGSDSPKAKKLQSMFPDEKVYAPNLNHDPVLAIKEAEKHIRQIYEDGHNKALIVGTSLGGFYGWYLSAKFDIPAILINPVYSPKEIMVKFLGKNKNFSTGEEFEWMQEHIDTLEQYADLAKKNYDKSLVKIIVAKDDDLIPYEKTIKTFTHDHTNIHVFDHGGHRFDDLEKIKHVIEPELKTKPFESLYEDIFN